MASAPSPRNWSLRTKQVLRRVLKSIPGQEYFVYVPSTGGQNAPLCVAVHGISRNAQEMATVFSSYAETLGVVLVAPHFTAEQHKDYQRLGRASHGTRADVVLDAIVEEVAWLTGVSTTQIYLFGYSGGAQFAHRYTLAHPERVARAAIASAGWYTFPDPRKRFPYGIKPSKDLPSVRFDPEEFLRVPITVLIGEEDTTTEGLRRTKRVNQQQGRTRVDRAHNWFEAMKAAAKTYHVEPQVSLQLVSGGNHSFKHFMEHGKLGARVFESLFGDPLNPTVEGVNGSKGPSA